MTLKSILARQEPDHFNPYEYLSRLNEETGDQRLMLSDEFRASDFGVMLKTALIAIELLSERVRELEASKASGDSK